MPSQKIITYLKTIRIKEKFPSTSNWNRKFAVLKCFCGSVFKVRLEKYTNGKVKSCGCSQYKVGSKLPYGEATLSRIYNNYRQNCKKKNRHLGISKNDLKELIHKPCYYCGRCDVSVIKTKFEICNYNGIDRVDSSMGYVIGNIVPCCVDCNTAKSDLPKDRFLELIKLIYEQHFKT